MEKAVSDFASIDSKTKGGTDSPTTEKVLVRVSLGPIQAPALDLDNHEGLRQ